MNFKTLMLVAATLITQPALAHHDPLAPFNDRFNQDSIKAVIDVAFETKSQRYTEFASLFNLCQKLPNNPQCGEKYDTKRTNYEIAKANHDVLLMTNDPEFIELIMPPSNYPEVVSALQTLGYLETKKEEVVYQETLEALNQWLALHSFAKTDEIYFMHALLVRAEELSQQLQLEKYPG